MEKRHFNCLACGETWVQLFTKGRREVGTCPRCRKRTDQPFDYDPDPEMFYLSLEDIQEAYDAASSLHPREDWRETFFAELRKANRTGELEV